MRALDPSTTPDNGKTSNTQPQNNPDDVRLDNDQRDGDEDADAIVEYLLANPYESDESPTAYWEGFQTSVGITRPITVFDTETEGV